MAAALQQPPQQPVNMAALKPLLDLRDGSKKPDSRISKALQEKFRHYNNNHSEIWNEIYSVGQLVDRFCCGDQILTRNPYTGIYAIVPVKRHDSSTPYAMNFMQFFRQNLIEKWEEATPDVNIRPGRNTDQSVIASKGANVMWKHYQKKFYNAWFSQQQCILGHSYGTYVDEIRMDDSEASLTVIRDVFEQKQVTMGDGYGFCPDCQNGGPARQFQPLEMGTAKCLECGGESASIEMPAQGEMQSASGTKQDNVGDLVCRQHPLPAIKFDLMKRLEDSSYLIVRQRIPKGAVTRLIGNLTIPSGASEDRDHGLDIIESSGWTGQALRGRGGYGYGNLSDEMKKDQITYDEMYLLPECYADINLMGDEETVGGATIPKGKLTDIFPDGMCVTGLNGMAVILAIYPEKHRDHFVSGVWFMRAMTGAGRGIVDSVEVQKRYNSFDSQRINYWGTMATPATFYDQEMIPGSRLKYLGTPRTNIPVNLTKLPETRKLADMLYQFTPASIPGAFLQYTDENLQKAFQYTTMVTNFQNGAPGITASNDTATAAQIDQSNSDAINGPIFQIKGEVWKREAEIAVEQFRRHFPMGRFFSIAGKYGKQQGQMVYGSDLCDDLDYEVAKGSHLPKGPMADRQNMMAMLANVPAAMEFAMMKKQDPAIANTLCQAFDVDHFEADDYDAIGELCRKRLEQMKEAEKVGVEEPEALLEAIDPPISSVEQGLAQQAMWYARWLTEDEGQEASMSLRKACELLAQGQIQSATAQDAALAANAGVVQAAGAAPGAMAQQAMTPPETPPQVDPNNIVNAQTQQMQNANDAGENEAQRSHELKMADREDARQKRDHANKLALVKAKPKVKTAGKK